MESFLYDAVMKGLISAGLPCLLLAAALWWFYTQWKAQQLVIESRRLEEIERQKTARLQEIESQKLFIETLNAERISRMTSMEKDIAECEQDRGQLRKEIITLLKEDRHLAIGGEAVAKIIPVLPLETQK